MKITRKGYLRIVNDYQETKDEQLIDEMVAYLSRTIKQLTFSNFERVSGYGYRRGDVYSIVLEVLWEVMEEFDGSQGSDFLAYFSQRVRWKINDELIEKKGCLADEQYYNAIPINNTEDGEEEGGINPNELFTLSEAIVNTGLYTYYHDLLNEYKNEPDLHLTTRRARESDVELLEEILKALMDGIYDDRLVNKQLYRKFPSVSKAAVLHRKRSASKRFEEYLKEKQNTSNIKEISS